MTTHATTNEKLVMKTNQFRLANVADRQRKNLYYLAGAATVIAAAAATIFAA